MTLPAAFTAGPIAHRGMHGDHGPENSLAAFQAAIDAGIAIEMDVQRSADDRAVAFHDDVLDRLTDRTGPVAAHPQAALTDMALNGGGTIPTLAEALDLIAGRVPLVIEIKDQDGALGPAIGPLEDAVVAALASYPGPVALMSFNPHSVAHLARVAPQYPRGLVTSRYDKMHWANLPDATRTRLRDIPDMDRTGACFISHEVDALDMPRVAEIKRAGHAILCWTVRSPEQEVEARRIADTVTFEGYLP